MNTPVRNVTRRDFINMAAATTAMLALDGCGWHFLSKGEQPDSLPVVVIGGGLGGLSAGAILSRNGFPVTLIEQHLLPGGYATSFDRGQYTFEVSLHATSAPLGGPAKIIYEKAGIIDRVQVAELPELCRILTPDHDIIWPQKNPKAITEELCRLFPSESKGIRGFMDDMLGILDEGMKPFDRGSWLDIIRFPWTHKRMWAIRNMTLGDLLDKHVRDTKVRTILSVFWPYYGLPPSKLHGFYYSIATAAYMRFGAYYIRERSQDLSNALMKSIEDAGGKVLLGTGAETIIVKEGAVTGVTLSNGKTLPARIVVSNASVPGTMNMLKPKAEFPGDAEKYGEKLKKYRPSLSTFNVWLGLNREIRGNIKGYEIFLNQHYDPEAAYRGALDCNPEKSLIAVTVYDNAFSGYSKPGTSTISILILSGYGPWKRFEQDYHAGRKDAYRKEKDRIADRLIDIVEKRVIPGLRAMIEVKETATPLTNVRYTLNPEGAIYGYEQSLDNSYMNRIQNTTPFGGLYLASAWGGMGGGFQPCLGSGLMAFEAIVKDRGVVVKK